MKLIQGHRPERSCQMNVFKEIEKAELYIAKKKECDSMYVSELSSIDDRYTSFTGKIYAAYLLGYSRGKKRGAKNAIAKRSNNVSC